MELVLRGNAGMRYTYPHTEAGVYVVDAVVQPTASESDSAMVPFVIYSPMGKTDEWVRFEGNTALADCKAMFGEKDWKRKGIVYDTLIDHLAAGGRALVINPRTSDAAMANATILLTTTPVDNRALWVGTDGTVYTTKPADSVVVKEFSLNTFMFTPIFQSIADMNSKEEVELAVLGLKKMTNPSAGVIPMYTASFIGRNKYGNNLDIYFQKSSQKIGDMNLFSTVIYNRDTKAPLGKYTATHGIGVYSNGIPLNLEEVITRFDKGRSVRMSAYEDVLEEEFNAFFIKMLDSLLVQIQDKITTDSLVELQTFYDFILDLKNLYVNDDTDVPAINLIDIFGQTNSSELNAMFVFPEDGTSYTMRLAEGNDGTLGQMKRYDYSFAVTEGATTTYPVIDLYKKVFEGTLSRKIYDTEIFNVDYIPDLDYPLEIKAAIKTFTLKRPDVAYLVNYLSTIRTYEELQAQVTAFKGEERTLVHYDKSVLVYNVFEKKNIRVPMTKQLNLEIIKWFNGGMKGSLAGNVFISGVVDVDDAVLPDYSTPEQLQWAFDNNINTLTKTKYGWMVDGQAGDLVGYEHPAKELFNILIIGRIFKAVIAELAVNKHFINEPHRIGEFNNLINSKVINKFKDKIDVTYKCYFEDEYAEATGTMTDEIVISGSNTVKRHDLKVYLANKYVK